MGSPSVTCHPGDPTQVNVPRLPPAMQAGTRFTYPGGMEGWVDLADLIAPRPGVKPATFWSRVQCRTAAPPRQGELLGVVAAAIFDSLIPFLLLNNSCSKAVVIYWVSSTLHLLYFIFYMCKPNDDGDGNDDDDMYCCMICVQYQLLFPTLLSLIEQISEKKVSFCWAFCLDCWLWCNCQLMSNFGSCFFLIWHSCTCCLKQTIKWCCN